MQITAVAQFFLLFKEEILCLKKENRYGPADQFGSNSLGNTPVYFLNAVLKLLVLEKPICSATCETEYLFCFNSSFALNILCS